jgi:hypothetical protein
MARAGDAEPASQSILFGKWFVAKPNLTVLA